jgi:hypothetical protein
MGRCACATHTERQHYDLLERQPTGRGMFR